MIGRIVSALIPITLFIAVFGFFTEPLISGDLIFFNLDHSFQNIPFRHYAFSSIDQGRMPLWCPVSAMGFPLYSEGQSGASFWPNWIFYLNLPFVRAYNLSLIFHFFLGLTGFYLLLRSIGMIRMAALTGSIGWGFSGYFIRRLMFVNFIQCMSLTPFLLWCWVRMDPTGQKRWLTAAGILAGMQWTAGHPQAAALSLVLLWLIIGFGPSVRELGHRLRDGLIITLTGAAAGACQWLPTLRMMLASARNPEQGFTGSLQMSFPPAFFPSLLLHDPFGNAARGTFHGAWHAYEWELSAYVGTVMVMLACLASLKKRWNRFFWGVTILGGVASLGSFTPAYGWIAHLPLLDSLRIPSRWMFLCVTGIAALAAAGMNRIMTGALSEESIRRYLSTVLPAFLIISGGIWLILRNNPSLVSGAITRSAGFAAAAAAAAGICIAAARHKRYAGIAGLALLGLIYTELWISGRSYPGVGPASMILEPPVRVPGIADGKPDHTGRILSLVHERLTPWDWHSGWNDGGYGDYPHLTESLPMYSGMLFDVDILTFDEWSPLHWKRYTELPSALGPELLNRMAVNRVLAPTRPLPFNLPRISGSETWQFLENPRAIPRTALVRGIRIDRSGHSSLTALKSRQYQADRIAFIEPPGDISCGDEPAAGTAHLTLYRPHSLIVRAEVERSGVLVIGDAWDPGWKARVNGNRVPVGIADHAFRYINLPSGECRVEMVYRPDDVRLGWFITLVTVTWITGTAVRMNPRGFEARTVFRPGHTNGLLFVGIAALICLVSGFLADPESWRAGFLNWIR